MKLLLAATATVLCLSSVAEANQITRTVPSGKTSVVFTYKPENRSCESAFGVATLIAKPQHGQVSHHLVGTEFTTALNDRSGTPIGCRGRPTTGFAVTYTPDPGFHGVDHFTLDVQQPEMNRHHMDGFAIIVE